MDIDIPSNSVFSRAVYSVEFVRVLRISSVLSSAMPYVTFYIRRTSPDMPYVGFTSGTMTIIRLNLLNEIHDPELPAIAEPHQLLQDLAPLFMKT